MSAATSFDNNHEPSQEEDDNLFRATGFRYSPALERGFPFPWCAKRSKKGWVVRDSPPPPTRTLPDNGVEFKGWKAASKMFQSREALVKRMESRGLSVVAPGVQAADKPSKKRKPTKQATAMAAVDDWFRHTQQAAQKQQKDAEEAQFDSYLQKKRLQYRQEIQGRQKQQKEERKRQREEDKRRAKEKANGQESAGLMKPPAAATSPLAMSPTRRKHKAAVPKRNRQANSVVLGEDPLLDDMISDIVLGFTDNSGGLEGSGLTFDDSAVQALREAAMDTARETLLGKQQGVAKGKGVALDESPDAKSKKGGTDRQAQQQGVDDTRIDGMIEQIIGDSGCHFDDAAVDALKEAVKEIAK